MTAKEAMECTRCGYPLTAKGKTFCPHCEAHTTGIKHTNPATRKLQRVIVPVIAMGTLIIVGYIMQRDQ